MAASFFDGWTQGGLWALAIGLDVAEPFFFGADGWKLMPEHFAERHGLIVIVALGESIVAIGVGAAAGIDAGVIVAAVLGVALVAAMWWLYFDVVAIVAVRRLVSRPAGREQNEMARDAYSYLHFPMVAGIVLIALGLKTTIAHVRDPLDVVPAVALCGGLAVYLLAHVAFRWRNLNTLNGPRLLLAAALLASIPIATRPTAVVALGVVAGVLCLFVAFEVVRYAEARDRIRHAPVDSSP